MLYIPRGLPSVIANAQGSLHQLLPTHLAQTLSYRQLQVTTCSYSHYHNHTTCSSSTRTFEPSPSLFYCSATHLSYQKLKIISRYLLISLLELSSSCATCANYFFSHLFVVCTLLALISCAVNLTRPDLEVVSRIERNHISLRRWQFARLSSNIITSVTLSSQSMYAPCSDFVKRSSNSRRVSILQSSSSVSSISSRPCQFRRLSANIVCFIQWHS